MMGRGEAFATRRRWRSPTCPAPRRPGNHRRPTTTVGKAARLSSRRRPARDASPLRNDQATAAAATSRNLWDGPGCCSSPSASWVGAGEIAAGGAARVTSDAALRVDTRNSASRRCQVQSPCSGAVPERAAASRSGGDASGVSLFRVNFVEGVSTSTRGNAGATRGGNAGGRSCKLAKPARTADEMQECKTVPASG
jgi:hypothetical protein